MEYSKINYINPSELKPYERNTKQHPDSQLTKLVKLIENYGFPESKAVLVDEQLTIICGHGRTLASIKAGLKEMPYQILTGASDADIKAMRIADNAVSESPWDYELLKLEYQDLELEDFDINILSLADEHYKEIEKMVDMDFGSDDSETVENEGHTQEIDVDEYKFDHTCPKCGFEYDD